MNQVTETASRIPSWIMRAGTLGLISGMILGLIVIGSELTGLGSRRLLLMVSAGLSLLAGGVAILALPFRRVRLRAVQVVIFSMILFLCTIIVIKTSMGARSWGFAWLAERSEPLVAAIKAYESTHGKPPKSLDDLVPAYLTEVPDTGMPAYPSYEYKRFPADAATRLHWYDLGSRNGQEFVGLWKYPDGARENAIFVIVTDRNGTIVEISGDRFPESVQRVKFDQHSWSNRAQRMNMLYDFSATVRPEGKPIFEIEKVLGPPDGSRTLLDTDWELSVPCSLGFLNWDLFFYWPSEIYPDRLYGGSIERIGSWAYVHE